jgi:hypothetical protein
MSQIEKGIRPDVPDSLNATVANIIQKGWAVNPAVRYSFDEIWSRLEGINFRLIADVNPETVSIFVSWVRTVAPRPPIPPVNKADMRSHAFSVPQEGLHRSFTLSFERNATARVVRRRLQSISMLKILLFLKRLAGR